MRICCISRFGVFILVCELVFPMDPTTSEMK